MESILPENPELIIKTEFEDIYSDEDEESSPLHPQIIINQALNVNGVPTHFICIKNVKFTKDAVIIDVVCDIEKNEDAEACQKTQKVLDSRFLKKDSHSEGHLNFNSQDEKEKILISDNLKKEAINDSCQKFLDSKILKKSGLSVDHLNSRPQDEKQKSLISDNLKQEAIDNSFPLKDCEDISDPIDKSNHKETQVKRKGFFKCLECDERFITSRHLKSHQKKIHENIQTKRVFSSVVPVLLQCGLCNEKFDNETILTLHMKTDHSKPHQRIFLPPKENISAEKVSVMTGTKCKFCDEMFTIYTKLKDHLLKVHGKTITYKDTKCDICNKNFCTPSALKQHKTIFHGQKEYQCDICSKMFSVSNNLILHKRHVHEKVKREKKHICNFCGLMKPTKFALNRHIQTVHEGLRPYECKKCKSTFKSATRMKIHIEKVHEGGTKHICIICKKDCSRSDVLKQHIQTVHEHRRDYKCPQCSKDFSTQSNLNNHLKTVHRNRD